MSHPSIFEYFDYRKYLKDYYENKKKDNKNFTYRFIASKVGVNHTFILKIFQGKKHIPEQSVVLFSKLLKLNRKEKEFFHLLIVYCKAKTQQEITPLYEKILSYREIVSNKIEGKNHKFYEDWFNTALREVIGIQKFEGDFKELSSRLVPAITPKQAEYSISLLTDMGLIKKNDDGTYILPHRFISPSLNVESKVVRNYQKDVIKLATKALENISKNNREISTATVSLSNEGYEKLKQRFVEFRKEVMRIADQDDKVSQTFQVNLNLFPVSNPLNPTNDA